MIPDMLFLAGALAGIAAVLVGTFKPAWIDNHLFHAWLGFRGHLIYPQEKDHGQDKA